MTPIEQAREALPRRLEALAEHLTHQPLTHADSVDITTIREAAAALARLSPSTPVDGVGAEPVAWLRRSKSIYGPYADEYTGDPELAELWRGHPNTIEVVPLYAAPLASPEAEARLRERVFDEDRLVFIQAWVGRLGLYPTPRVIEAVLAAAEARLAQAEGGPAVTEAARDVRAERRRQVEAEGWTPEHDDAHASGEMGRAAGIYALAASDHDYRWVLRGSPVHDYLAAAMKLWPWDWSWFKPTNRRRDLVKAGALILAEIERLDRAARHPQSAAGEEGKP